MKHRRSSFNGVEKDLQEMGSSWWFNESYKNSGMSKYPLRYKLPKKPVKL